MGRQVRFFVTDNDIDDLIEVIHQNNGQIITRLSKQCSSLADFKEKDDLEGKQFFIKFQNSKLINRGGLSSHILDQLSSEVVEVSLCRNVNKEIVDVSMLGKTVEPIYIPNPDYSLSTFECGRIWYESKYYDEQGNIVEKSEDLKTMFDILKKYIRKNYHISVQKDYYIGPDAYLKYLKGEFKTKAGRYDIVF